MTYTYTHATIPCAALDEQGRIPTEEQIAGVADVWLRYAMQARKAQVHLDMRMALLKAEEQQQAAVSPQPGR